MSRAIHAHVRVHRERDFLGQFLREIESARAHEREGERERARERDKVTASEREREE